MGSTGKLVVSYEADTQVVYRDKLRDLETRVKNILTPYAKAFDEMSNADEGTSLLQMGNTFILRILYMNERTFYDLLESLRAASRNSWLLVYGGLDYEASILLEIQNKEIIMQRHRKQLDDLNDYSDLPNHSTEDA